MPEATSYLARDVLGEIAKNLAMGLPPVRAWRLRRPRAASLFTHRDQDLERYAFQALRSLTKVVGRIHGMRIVEFGPGDYLTSGFSLLAAGAAFYTAVDRFPGNHGGTVAKQWYAGIQDAWPRLFPGISWPEGLRPLDFPEAYAERIQVVSQPIERLTIGQRFDVVCSFQVGEHVSDLDAFAQTTARLLAPNGIAVHAVDFGPHDCWRAYPDPFTFLRFPDWLWALMGSNRGTPNRHRHHEFEAAFESAGLRVSITGVQPFLESEVGLASVATRFRTMPRDSLMVRRATYFCRPREKV